MHVITNNQELADCIKILKNANYIAIDTEFLRRNTYYPKLCLFQIATRDKAYVIDVLKKDIKLDPLFEVIFDEDILKIFHSARQDLEIIYNITKQIPYPIFDTQIAASVLKMGDHISYEKLVFCLLSKELNKKVRYTDWSRRPLSKDQIEYAFNDVVFLVKVYEIVDKLIKDNKFDKDFSHKTSTLYDIDNYNNLPENAWKRLKTGISSVSINSTIKRLTHFRELYAQKLDIPRQHFLDDKALFSIAKFKPNSIEDLYKIEDLEDNFIENFGQELLKFIDI